MFRIGQKVVCINEGPDWLFRNPLVKKGRIYTVKENVSVHGVAGVTFYELIHKHAPGWTASWFRPVNERKTDISMFLSMLKKKPLQA